jgi:hypothetical protein
MENFDGFNYATLLFEKKNYDTILKFNFETTTIQTLSITGGNLDMN